ncbi:tyrosine-type recombinase/integrase [Microbispora sp. NBRC 16548]|uniref:tyrosine-type recombinase/integrase n=1 Tax=Microbispora sp. NBRC 16548 TaxID=3030994 RepID=UPI00161FA7A3|nr:tyrosine-type recombinase/integrase [Microbispora sp. NBRC 16548]
MAMRESHAVVYKRCGCTERSGRCPRLLEDGHGSWYFAVQIRGLSGCRERARRGGYASAGEAEQAGRQLIAAEQGGPIGTGCTVAQWLRYWLATDQGIRPRTRQGYADHVRLHLVPALGRIMLSELSHCDVRRMFTALAGRRNRYGRPLATATLERIRATLRAALNEAVREGLIDSNPARALRLPAAPRPRAQVWTDRWVAAWKATGERPTVAVWTIPQLVAFLDDVREDPLFPLWWLAALRGLRRGELAGLRWVDLSLERAELAVVQQLVHVGGKLVPFPPKSAASRRTVALDSETVRLLRRHERDRRAEKIHRGEAWDDTAHVFTRTDGAPVAPDYLTYRFHKLVRRSGLPPVRLHDLRHGAVTLALAAHVDLSVVQDQVGHASIVLTADTYTSVLPELHHRAAGATARLVLSAARGTARKVLRGRCGWMTQV